MIYRLVGRLPRNTGARGGSQFRVRTTGKYAYNVALEKQTAHFSPLVSCEGSC